MLLFATISITSDEILKGFILYGIIHGLYKLVYKLIGLLMRRLHTEADYIIKKHVFERHEPKLKDCLTEDCARFQTSQRQPEVLQLS